jgi:hypothetical protein
LLAGSLNGRRYLLPTGLDQAVDVLDGFADNLDSSGTARRMSIAPKVRIAQVRIAWRHAEIAPSRLLLTLRPLLMSSLLI